MAGKPKKVLKKHAGGKARASGKDDVFDRRVDDFAEEVENLADSFGKRMERRGDEWNSWFRRTFGLAGPLLSAVFGMIILGLIIWATSSVNYQIASPVFSGMHDFLLYNAGIFLIMFLVFSYAAYFSKAYCKSYMLVSPVFTAIGITAVFWILANVMDIANITLGVPFISTASYYVGVNLFPIFWFFLVAGYLFLSIRAVMSKSFDMKCERPAITKKPPAMKYSPPARGTKRLYRSGRDKILGGVCGGIAEYLEVDPVIIRLLWVAGSLAWGFGILLYIIFWIVMPRNPDHKW